MLSKKLLVLGKKHMFGVRAVGGIKKEKKKKKTIGDPAGWDPINDWTLGLILLGWLIWDKNLNEEVAKMSFWGHRSARNGCICPQHQKCPLSARSGVGWDGAHGSLNHVFFSAGEDSGRGKENDSVVKTREGPATD